MNILKLSSYIALLSLFACGLSGMDAPPIAKPAAQGAVVVKEIDETRVPLEQLKINAQAGSVTAKYELASRYHFGTGGAKKSPQLAAELFKEAANAGHPSALYSFGLWYEKDADKARGYCARAAELGEIFSLYAIAKHKKGVSASDEASYLEKVIDDNAVIRPTSDLQYLNQLNQTRAKAACRLGELFEEGRGVVRSTVKAEQLYRKSIEYSLTEDACYRRARLLVSSDGIVPDLKEAERLISKISDTHAPAQCLMGRIRFEQRRYQEAIKFFANVQFSSGEAAYYLGICKEEGHGTKTDLKAALDLYHDAAVSGFAAAVNKLILRADGNPAVQCTLGKIYREGKAVAISEVESVRWLLLAHSSAKAIGKTNSLPQHELDLLYENINIELKALGKTSSLAQYELGRLYENKGNQAAINEAVSWYQKAAVQNHHEAAEAVRRLAQRKVIPAKIALAHFHEKGVAGCEKNSQRSLELLKEAVEDGSAEAAEELGDIYLTGLLGHNGDEEAMKWYGKAVELRSVKALDKLKKHADTNVYAQCVLGQLYETDKHGFRDLSKAESLYRKAIAVRFLPAYAFLADLLEQRPALTFNSGDEIIRHYMGLLELYSHGAKKNDSDAQENFERIQEILNGLNQIVKEQGIPDFQTFLFTKLKPQFATECPISIYYWAAHIAQLASNYSDVIKGAVSAGLISISKLSRKGRLAPILLKMLSELLCSPEFRANRLQEQHDDLRLRQIYKLCHGASLALTEGNVINPAETMKLSPTAVFDPWIRVYNELFNGPRSPVNEHVYSDAVNALVTAFIRLKHKISGNLLRDDALKLSGDENSLRDFLTAFPTDSFKRKVTTMRKIILSKLNEADRITVLCGWALAGLRSSPCKEMTMRATCKRYAVDLEDLDKENYGLAVRIALSLAELRKKCVAEIVPATAPFRDQQIAFLERSVLKRFVLVEDESASLDFNTEHVERQYKDMAVEEIVAQAQQKYTLRAMNTAISSDGNKERDARIPYQSILAYFRKIMKDEAAAIDMMASLYVSNGFRDILDEKGAKILMYHFGYIE